MGDAVVGSDEPALLAEANRLLGAEHTAGVATYLARFPEAGALTGQVHYTITVSWLRLLDRRTGLSREVVIEVSAG